MSVNLSLVPWMVKRSSSSFNAVARVQEFLHVCQVWHDRYHKNGKASINTFISHAQSEINMIWKRPGEEHDHINAEFEVVGSSDNTKLNTYFYEEIYSFRVDFMASVSNGILLCSDSGDIQSIDVFNVVYLEDRYATRKNCKSE